MGLKVRYRSTDGFPEMKKRLQGINGKAVEVGVLKGKDAWLASIHEYGCDIEITDHMRAYLRGQGLYLKSTTTHIHIPERSFLRTGFDVSRDDVMAKAQKVLLDVASGRTSARGCLQAVGLELSSKIRDYALSLDTPANHPFTIDQKGSSNPLADTGDMIGGISWRISK